MKLAGLAVFLLLAVFQPTDCGAERSWAAAVEPPAIHEGEWRPPIGEILFSPGPVGRAVLVPENFAWQSIAILACESRRDSWAAVGDQGRAFGGFQIREDVHRADMERAGLDFWQERDRIRWATHLWESSGRQWAPHWRSCAP